MMNRILPQLICKYQNDNSLDNLRDILDYLKVNCIYIPTKIKISKQKMFKLSSQEISFLLEKPYYFNQKKYFAVYSDCKFVLKNSNYFLELNLNECFKIMKKLKLEMIVVDKSESKFLINKDIIEYLKYCLKVG